MKQIVLVALFLFAASCSGGGCSSGCAQCGTTPLPGGFPKPQTIPNAAAVRVTRPGLDFLQENLGTLAVKALGTSAKDGILTFPIPKSSQTLATICNTAAAPVPPQCQAEINLGTAKVRVNAITPNKVKIDGLLAVRISDLPVQLAGFFNAYVVAGDAAAAPGGNLCSAAIRGKPTFPFKEFPLNIELPLVTENRIPRNGYTKVDVDNAVIDIGITQNDVEICDATCGAICQGALDFVKGFAFNTLVGGIKDQLKTALAGGFCTAPTPTVTPPCPTGSEPNDKDLAKATKCVFAGTQECVPSLLGTDGRMDLSKALASFSPGSQGGLDFVLASAGDMNPAPNETTLPAWTPRKPPVPAQDNNKNGLSLTLLGGALPQPESRCVVQEINTVPVGIPIPAELTGDTLTGWPAGTPGPHLGVSLAGRYLNHALVSAYNSGVLCLGVSTEQVEQLSTGYLSILAPALKNLTLGQGPGAAAITTRPGRPPKAKVGNGTNVDTDPTLTLQLDQFAIDFYVWHLDRFARAFTYTADITVPVLLETGKSDANPNGGLLPKLGKIALANGAVTNADLLLDEPATVAGGITGLVGGLVGQFLGGGFSPIDIASALSSVGVGMEIPTGGIRKLTSGQDEFLAIFANLKTVAGTAREEADTRASITNRFVDPTKMSLTTAQRDAFPTLRVHVEPIATKPTEQTWWVDNGPHSPWTTARDLVVDNDAMLLQGKHVLHVASRIVGDVASEDSTPALLPFVVDTLPPRVSVERVDGNVTIDAYDFVSPGSALVARYRIAGGAFSEWSPLGSLGSLGSNGSLGSLGSNGGAAGSLAAAPNAAVDVEVRDEEGNVARVSAPLIRGRGDSSLETAGAGCNCNVVGAAGASSASGDRNVSERAPLAVIGAIASLSLALVRARRRRARP